MAPSLPNPSPHTNVYAQWFSRLVWLGIATNVFFIIPLCFFPEFLLNLFHMTIPVPLIWVRAAGLLLLEITIIYIPGALDPYRYKAIAWMSVFVTRGGGAFFFLIAVLFFNQELGFLTIALVDLLFGTSQGIFLYLAMKDQSVQDRAAIPSA